VLRTLIRTPHCNVTIAASLVANEVLGVPDLEVLSLRVHGHDRARDVEVGDTLFLPPHDDEVHAVTGDPGIGDDALL